MVDNITQLVMDEDEPMQAQPIYLSSDEDTETQYLMSGQELTINHDQEKLNQLVINPNDPTDVAQVRVSTCDVQKPTLSPSATTESQLSKNIHNVPQVTEYHYFQSRPYRFELRELLPTRDSPESLTPSNKKPTKG